MGPNSPEFKQVTWYKPLYAAVLSSCFALGLWVLRSGALAMWDRHSPVKVGPILSWPWAIILSAIGGFVLAVLIMLQIELWYERRRDQR